MMTGHDNDKDNDDLRRALESVPVTAHVLARHLRMMAAGEDPYRRFTYMSPWIKNIWRAAADVIDAHDRQGLH